MNKLSDICIAFCVGVGGISLVLVKHTDFVMFLILLAVSMAVMLVYSALVKSGKTPETSFKYAKNMLAVCAISSSGMTVAISSALVTDTFVMDRSALPLIVTVTGLFALCVALSSKTAVAKTSVAAVISAVLIFAVLLLLSVVETDFSTVTIGKVNYNLLFPLAAFSVLDTVFVLPLISRKGGKMLILGNAAAALYMAVMTLIALSVLSKDIFLTTDMPIMKLWQSTYIASFLSRFETVAISAFYILSALKAGLVLHYSVDTFSKNCALIIAIIMFLTAALILFFPALTYFVAVMSFVSGAALPLLSLFKKIN